MSLKDYYTILEVPSNATLEQIKRSYRRLVRMYHPDLNKHTHDADVKRLNEAYGVLSDVAKRTAYDMQLLEELRRSAIRETLRHQQEAVQRRQTRAQREPKMTWTQGVVGFVRELKKGMQEE